MRSSVFSTVNAPNNAPNNFGSCWTALHSSGRRDLLAMIFLTCGRHNHVVTQTGWILVDDEGDGAIGIQIGWGLLPHWTNDGKLTCAAPSTPRGDSLDLGARLQTTLCCHSKGCERREVFSDMASLPT